MTLRPDPCFCVDLATYDGAQRSLNCAHNLTRLLIQIEFRQASIFPLCICLWSLGFKLCIFCIRSGLWRKMNREAINVEKERDKERGIQKQRRGGERDNTPSWASRDLRVSMQSFAQESIIRGLCIMYIRVYSNCWWGLWFFAHYFGVWNNCSKITPSSVLRLQYCGNEGDWTPLACASECLNPFYPSGLTVVKALQLRWSSRKALCFWFTFWEEFGWSWYLSWSWLKWPSFDVSRFVAALALWFLDSPFPDFLPHYLLLRCSKKWWDEREASVIIPLRQQYGHNSINIKVSCKH